MLKLVFAFGFGFCRAGNQSAQDGRACVVDAVAVVSGIEAAHPAGFVLAAVRQRVVLFDAARQCLDAVVAAFLYAPHRVALAAVDVDGFFRARQRGCSGSPGSPTRRSHRGRCH